MDWLNYHHLLYFWTVVQQGGVTRAAKKLGLTQPTISGQLKSLEDSLGEPLFDRSRRELQLTETGRIVYEYAQQIFALGREMQSALRGRPGGNSHRLLVGVSSAVPKLVTYRLLAPALELDPPALLVCEEGRTDQLLANLSVNGLDLVLADEPLSGAVNVKAYSHALGESGLSVFGQAGLRKKFGPGFPASLDGAPMLMAPASTATRRGLDRWFDEIKVRPTQVGEFSDSALIKVFGEHGAGLFVAPTVIERDVCETYGVEVVGRTTQVKERFYAISVERRIKNPAVVAIVERGRQTFNEL